MSNTIAWVSFLDCSSVQYIDRESEIFWFKKLVYNSFMVFFSNTNAYSRLQENLNILCVWCVGGWDGWGGRGEGHWVTGHNNFCFQKIHDVELLSAEARILKCLI